MAKRSGKRVDKKRKKLQGRQKSWNDMMARGSEAKVGQRKRSGGYRCPGSMK